MEFAEIMFEYKRKKSKFESDLYDVGFLDYEKIGGDYYDYSIEFYGVGNDVRLNAEQQKTIRDGGFVKCYLNHKDGWETHYTWGSEPAFLPKRGWRRRYVGNPNVLVGEPNPGYYEISYWPEGWKTKEWLDSGYMRIVSDPLDTGIL